MVASLVVVVVSTVAEQIPLPGFDPERCGAAGAPIALDRVAYREECAKRWWGPARRDAFENFASWQEMQPMLIDAMRGFHADPFQTDLSGKCHNPDGTLTAFVWKMQEAIEPDKSCLRPFLDFEEYHQKVFIRRGLIIALTMILRQIEGPRVSP